MPLPKPFLLFLFYLLFLFESCQPEENRDPIPVLTFQSDVLICYTEEPSCYNPVSTSIRKGIPLPDGTFLLQSGTISLATSDASIAEPSGNGLFYLKKPGECIITATQQAVPGYNAKGKGSFKLIVKQGKNTLPTLTWYQEAFHDMSAPFYLGIGDSIINPVTSSVYNGGDIMYYSSNEQIASVNNVGLVKCHQLGEVVITAHQNAKEGINQNTQSTYHITIDPRSIISFAHGNQYTCTIDDGMNYNNIWSSSIPNGGSFTIQDHDNIAFIDYAGNIEANRSGKATITIIQEAKHGVNVRSQGSFELVVLPPKPVLSFSEGFEYLCSTVNGGCQNIVNNIENDYLEFITYASSQPDIATIDNDGVITPVSPGTVTITANLAEVPSRYQQTSGNFTLRIIDYPIPALTWFSDGADSRFFSCFFSNIQNCKLKVTSNIPTSAITYSCDDPNIASIDVNGVITPLKLGSTTVTASQPEVPGVNGFAKITFPLIIRE